MPDCRAFSFRENLPLGLHTAAVVTYRVLLDLASDSEEKGGLLNNLSVRLGDVGDRRGALDAIKEAVEIRRRLAAANPAAFEPDLATSLNNLSGRLR